MQITSSISDEQANAHRSRRDDGTPPPNSTGGNDIWGNSPEQQPFGNALVAMALFLGADFMFFASLIGTFIVFRYGADTWPPAGQPTLPIGVTAMNTFILLASGVSMALALRAARRAATLHVGRYLLLTLALGATFLLIQGYEWVRLISFGLRLSTGVFGGTFYTLIGCHGLHVVGAVLWLCVIVSKLHRNPEKIALNGFNGVKLASMYWFLVVALWPVLYGLVYLS